MAASSDGPLGGTPRLCGRRETSHRQAESVAARIVTFAFAMTLRNMPTAGGASTFCLALRRQQQKILGFKTDQTMSKPFVFIPAAMLAAASMLAETSVEFKRTEDVIYGRKFGTALTMDVVQPARTNGIGILWMVSGGWFSSHDAIKPDNVRPLLARGYTIFAIVHGSQPKFTIPEIEQDVHRAVRFVRHHAASYGLDPKRLGITGGSAGGHLSLTMAVKGAKGNQSAKDPIDRESSEVQCVACFFPPTDFLNYGQPGEDAVGVGILKNFKAAFGPLSDTPDGRQKLGQEISPIYFVHSNTPPILIFHGDADKLVPIQQARSFVKHCDELGREARLIVREGKEHGWSEMGEDLKLIADWFDEHLRGTKARVGSRRTGE
jgi:acetyl esterase/lipase